VSSASSAGFSAAAASALGAGAGCGATCRARASGSSEVANPWQLDAVVLTLPRARRICSQYGNVLRNCGTATPLRTFISASPSAAIDCSRGLIREWSLSPYSCVHKPLSCKPSWSEVLRSRIEN
jgi:hypothetical protein